jgi:hypothetical protein
MLDDVVGKADVPSSFTVTLLHRFFSSDEGYNDEIRYEPKARPHMCERFVSCREELLGISGETFDV